MSKIICFIPVRKNSKEIVGKNMKDLNGKPLISFILDTLIISNIADEIWVATDWDELKFYVENNYKNKVTIFDRNPLNASDESPSIDVVLEFLNKTNFDLSDKFVLIQATSPFTTLNDFFELRNILRKNKYDSVVSCCRLKRFRWEESGISIDYNLKDKKRRQDYNGFLVESGNYYASNIKNIKETRQLLSGKIFPIEVSSISSIEIDTEFDWIIAEAVSKYIK